MDTFTFVGVVPIFVNLGAALLPTILAALAFAVGLLFRPRELYRVCRNRPVIPILIAVAAFGGWFAVTSVAKVFRGRSRRAPVQASADAIDWAQVAREILRARAGETPVAFDESSSRTGATIFRTDASRCGYDGDPSPIRLTPLWEHTEWNAMYLSSPAVVGARLYGASCVLDPPGNYGSVFCLDAETGEKDWLVEFVKDPATGEEIELKGFFSSPAVTEEGQYVVIGQGLHYDKDCNLLCFRADTGALHWRVPTPLHIESSPAILGDLVVAGAGAIENADLEPIGDPGYVVAVRISDGTVLWRYPVNDPESSPVISDDGIVYIGSGFNGSELVALRTESDEQLKATARDRVVWRRKTPYPATGAVTLAGDLAIIGCGNGNYIFAAPNPAGTVLAFDRHTGEIVWRLDMPDAVLGSVAVRDSQAVCSVRNGQVVAIDLAKAALELPREEKIVWRTQVSGSSPVLTGPAFTGEYVYSVSKDGYLAVIRAADGEIAEKHFINDEGHPGELGLSISSPTVAGGRLFVGSETGGLRCFCPSGKSRNLAEEPVAAQ